MDEHLAAWQIAAFILGGLDEDTRGSLSARRRVRGLRGLVGGRYSGRGLRVNAERRVRGYVTPARRE